MLQPVFHLVFQGHRRVFTMQILQEIINIVTSKKDARLSLPELDSESPVFNTLAARFIQGIAVGEFESDDDAAEKLYGTTSNDPRYRTMKSRTYNRLLQSVLFLQVRQPEHSEYLTNYYRCMRNTFVAQTLMRFAARKAGYAIALKAFSIAKRYQFTDLCLTLSVILRETSAVWFRRAAFLHHHADVQLYIKQLEAEYQADYLLDYLSMETNIASRSQSHLLALHESTLESIQALNSDYGTFQLTLNHFRASLYYYDLREDYHAVMRVCDQAVEFLDRYPHLSQKARYGEFILQKMVSALTLRQYREAYALSERCIDSFAVAGNNWFFACDLSFIAAINLEDYEYAERVQQMATSQRKITLQPERTRERWVIYGAYLYLAEQLGLYTPVSERSRPFRLTTFMNSVPELSKSKKVYNVLILISQLYILILNGDYDAAERRGVYLRVYASRYLKESHFARIRLFLKILHTFPRYSFLSREIRENTKHLRQKLEASRDSAVASEINELIPFEVMIDSILQHIERREREDGI